MEEDQIMNQNESQAEDNPLSPKAKTRDVPFSHNLFHAGAALVTPPHSHPREKEAKKQSEESTLDVHALMKDDSFLEDANLLNLLKTYQPSQLSQQRWNLDEPPPRMKGPLKDCDILFGRGNRIGGHAGNKLMRRAIALNQTYYRAADRQKKQIMSDALVAFFESRGTRFVEEISVGNPCKGYVHVAYERVVEKFMQALREKINYRNTGLAPEKLKNVPQTSSKPKTGQKPVRATEGILGCATDYRAAAKKVEKLVKKVARAVKVELSPARVIVKNKDKGNNIKGKKKVTAAKAKSQHVAWSSVKKGDRLGIYWDLDKIYYPGEVEFVSGPKAWILYDDGERECVDLSTNKFFRWRQEFDKRLRPPGTSPKSPPSDPNSRKASSPGNSIQTQDSTESGDAAAKPAATEEKNRIVIQGAFSRPVAAPSLSLVSFLHHKLHRSSAKKKRYR